MTGLGGARADERLDLRGLEPPEPMRRALEAIEGTRPGGVVEVVTDREPTLLHRELDRRGHRYLHEVRPDGFHTIVERGGAPLTSKAGVENLEEALKEVIDPELGYNIVDLGFVYELAVEEDRARILLTTTTPGCPATDFIRQAVESRAALVPGIGRVEVVMTWLPPWSPERMSDEAKAHFGVSL